MVAALLSSLALGLSISPPRVEPLRWAFDTVATLELGLFPGLRLGVDIERRTAGGKGDGIMLRTIPEGATVGRYEGVVIKRQEHMDGELSSTTPSTSARTCRSCSTPGPTRSNGAAS